MPTYAQLAQEPAWNAEDAPPNLDEFYRLLRVFYNLPASHIGGRGDNNHVRGYHRSRRWINESQYSKFGKDDYSIQLTLDQGGDDNWYSALDMTVPAQKLYDACRRLDAAVRAGQIPQLREWYGSFDGKTVVGYRFDENGDGRPATSDSSHLWHLHISFYRSRADWDHTLLYQTITGIGDGMAINDRVLLAPGNPDTADNKELQAKLNERGADPPLTVDGSYGNKTTTAVKAEQAAAGYPQSGSLDVKLWVVLDQTPPPPEPGPDPEPEPGEPVDYDRIRLIVREELDATQVTVDLQPGD